jgi:hypothetical protein
MKAIKTIYRKITNENPEINTSKSGYLLKTITYPRDKIIIMFPARADL